MRTEEKSEPGNPGPAGNEEQDLAALITALAASAGNAAEKTAALARAMEKIAHVRSRRVINSIVVF